MSKEFTRKLALFVNSGDIEPRPLMDWADSMPGYVRLSEYTEVTFVPLPDNIRVEAQLNLLNEQEQALRNRFQEKLNEIEFARGKLLALTNQVA